MREGGTYAEAGEEDFDGRVGGHGRRRVCWVWNGGWVGDLLDRSLCWVYRILYRASDS